MAQVTQAFDAATIGDLSTKINVFLAANPGFTVTNVAIEVNSGHFFAIVAYH